MKMKIKSAIALTSAVIMSFSNIFFSCNFTGYASEVIGDANSDGVLSVRDAAFIASRLAQNKSYEIPSAADYNCDGNVNVRDAAAIACYLSDRSSKKTQINFRFADKSEAIELRLANESYFNNLTQQDLNYRMQKTDATLDEYREFCKAQILDFTDKQKQVITETIDYIQNIINKNGYKLPMIEEIVFINTTAKDECDSAAYTQKNQIYISNMYLSDSYSGLLRKIIAHEIFHCITRANPQFREDMYKIIGFSIADEQPEFPEEVGELLLSNPDVEKNDSYAEFTINGEKRNCFMASYLTKPFEKEGDNFFFNSTTVLIPVDDLSTVYTMDEVSDFWEVVGENTDYVIAAEECLAENFSLALIFGAKGLQYKSPEIIESIIKYMKSYN